MSKMQKLQIKFIRFFISFFYVGFLPLAPGTWGTIPGLFLYPLWARYWWTLPLLFCFSYLAIGQYPVESEDPQWIVVDEVLGIGTACTLYFYYYGCYHWLGLLLLFCFFRLFDIVKPFPIDWIERRTLQFSLPLSILLDDIVAGVFAGLATIFVMPPII